VEYSDGGKVYLERTGEDTIYAYIGNWKKTIPLNVTKLCQKHSIPDEMKLIIWADTHKLINPQYKNYPIPIHIKSDKNISNIVIEKLIIEIDKNIFYPRKVDNGMMTKNYIDSVVRIIIENIKVSDLKSDEDTILLTIWGDVILGNKDSGLIDLKEIIFFEDVDVILLEDGYITLNVCQEGGSRHLMTDVSPSIRISNNPAIDILKVKCNAIEIGDYILEIVDILGNIKNMTEFSVTSNDNKIFEFEIPIQNFCNGNYFIIMRTPTNKYYHKFLIKK